MTDKPRIRLFNNGRAKVWVKVGPNHWRTKVIQFPLVMSIGKVSDQEALRYQEEARWRHTCAFILNVKGSNVPVDQLNTVPDRMTGQP